MADNMKYPYQVILIAVLTIWIILLSSSTLAASGPGSQNNFTNYVVTFGVAENTDTGKFLGGVSPLLIKMPMAFYRIESVPNTIRNGLKNMKVWHNPQRKATKRLQPIRQNTYKAEKKN